MYRFLRRPRWIAGLLLAAVCVAAFAWLGTWQLRRLDERRDANARITQRMQEEPVPLRDVTAIVAAAGVEAAEYRHVTATGAYDVADEVIWLARTRAGRPGHHVLTPLRLAADPSALVVVDRGWVPFDADEPPVAVATPPAGEVTVTGVVRAGQTATGLGPDTAAEGVVDRLGRIDLARIGAQVEGDVAPFYVQLTSQQPPQPGELPVPAAPPDLGEANHLSYALQWFTFATVVAVGMPLLVRRIARDQRPSCAAGADAAGAPDQDARGAAV